MQLSSAITSYNPYPALHSLAQLQDPFSQLTGEARDCFNLLGVEKTFTRGDRLFIEGQEHKFVYVLLSGRVKLSVTSRDGKTMILRIAEPGNLLGLSATLNSCEHEVTAEATEYCRVKAVRAHDFIELMEKYPEVAMEATKCLLKEHGHMFKDVCRLALPATVAGRLANLLLDWREQRAKLGQAEPRLAMPLTQEEIASMTGTSRETVSRVLHQFQRDKLISIKGAFLTVLQPKALEQLAI